MEQNEIEKKRLINAIEFLVFAYWGFCFNDGYGDDLDTMLTKIVNKAYNDAAGQGAFNALIKKEETDLRRKADEAKEKAKKTVKESLKAFEGNDYRQWHEDTCGKVKKCFSDRIKDDNVLWSYGNSQKLVNMSVKYLITATYIFKSIGQPEKTKELCDIGDKFISVIGELDIPVDSYIIEASKERLKEGWSKWCKNQYDSFEKTIKEKYNPETPFDWEGPAWIKIAKNR